MVDLVSLLGPLAPLAPLVNAPFIVAVVFIVQLIKKVVTDGQKLERKSVVAYNKLQQKNKKIWILIVLGLGFVMAAIVNVAFGWEGEGILAIVATYTIKGVIYASVASYFYQTKNFFPDKKEK